MQAPTPSSEVAWTKQDSREARKLRREQSRRAAKKNLVAQKQLKAQRQEGACRRQCQTAAQRARRLLDQSELGNARHENETTTTTQPATRVFTQPATSSLETMWVKTRKAWTWEPCLQTLTSEYNMRAFPALLLEESVWQQGKTSVLFWIWHLPFRCHHSNTDCVNSSFKVHFMC